MGWLRGGLIACWLGVQPWLVWPALFAETSQRLTLVCLCAALGLLTCLESRWHAGLPAAMVVSVLWAVGVMTWHQWPIIQDGGYFEFFQESALFSDGLLLLLAWVWGLWAWRQCPRRTWRWVAWGGVAFLALNAGVIVVQALGYPWTWGVVHPGKLSGLLGSDRILGAVGVFWFPWVWRHARGLVWLPLTLVVVAGKVTAWLGLLTAWLWLSPCWGWLLAPLGGWAAWHWTDGNILLKISQRWETWTHTWQAILQHPWVGWGFHPMMEVQVRQTVGYALPSLHSDWLSLAFRGGLPLLLLAVGTWSWICWRGRRHAMSAGLMALGVMACGQAIISQASIAGLVIAGTAWVLQASEVA